MKQPTSLVFNEDCTPALSEYTDDYFDLAIVAPPYGIGVDGQAKTSGKHGGRRAIPFKGWDNQRPTKKYFDELFRVSKNQIIWGANYFTQFIPPSMGWVFWDKGQRICSSDGELAFTSFSKALRIVTINRNKIQAFGGGFHPTQKPVKLYEWLLRNYAKPGDKILDTHLGSQSSRIAAYKLGFDFWGYEIDLEYFEQGNARFERAIAMPLFDKAETYTQGKIFD